MMLIIAPLSLPAKPLSPTVNPFKNLNLPKLVTPKFHMRRLSEASACTAQETLTKTTDFATDCSLDLTAISQPGWEPSTEQFASLCDGDSACGIAVSALAVCYPTGFGELTAACGAGGGDGSSCTGAELAAASGIVGTECGITDLDNWEPSAAEINTICASTACLAGLTTLGTCFGEDVSAFCSAGANAGEAATCAATCANAPESCAEAEAFAGPGGCANKCSSSFIADVLGSLGCSSTKVEPQIISVVMVASGTVEDYGEAEKDSIAQTFATKAGVAKDKVAVTVTSASVNINVEIEAAGTASAAAIEAEIDAVLADATTATAFLQQAVPTATVTAKPTKETKAAPKASDPCFPSSAKVTKADGTTALISSLKEGDKIVAATADGMLTTDTVSLLSLSKPQGSAPMVALRAGNATLTLTAEHHVPVGAACCSELKQAKDVNVGDKVWAVRAGAPPLATTVAAKSNTHGKGLHSPVLTHGGFPIVDGLVTSFDSIEKVTLAKHGLAPLITACKATGTCDTFRAMFLAGDRKYVEALNRRRL